MLWCDRREKYDMEGATTNVADVFVRLVLLYTVKVFATRFLTVCVLSVALSILFYSITNS